MRDLHGSLEVSLFIKQSSSELIENLLYKNISMTLKLSFLKVVVFKNSCYTPMMINEVSYRNETNNCSKKQFHLDLSSRPTSKHIRLPVIIGAFY